MTLPVLNIPPLPPLGNDTVIFLHYVDDPGAEPDAMGEISQTPTRVEVTGCRHRAIPATHPAQRETPDEIFDVGQQVWQTHCPVTNRDDNGNLITAPLDATLNDAFEVNGVTYQIQGDPVPVTGATGAVEFVKILSRVQVG
jgi:hypothetical protein